MSDDDKDLLRTGKVWKFGDDINSDLIFPSSAFMMDADEQHKLIFSANRPGWIELVQPGDILVAGQNFGLGSGRPIGKVLAHIGIRGIVAESINGIGFRNCINSGLPAMAMPDVGKIVDEGDEIAVNFSRGTVKNLHTQKEQSNGTPLPDALADIVRNGGAMQMLISEGLLIVGDEDADA